MLLADFLQPDDFIKRCITPAFPFPWRQGLLVTGVFVAASALMSVLQPGSWIEVVKTAGGVLLACATFLFGIGPLVHRAMLKRVRIDSLGIHGGHVRKILFDQMQSYHWLYSDGNHVLSIAVEGKGLIEIGVRDVATKDRITAAFASKGIPERC